MRRFASLKWIAPGLAAAGFLAGCASMPSADAVLRQSEAAMGGAQVKTLRIAAAGTGATYGQAYVPGNAWPRINLSLQRWADYENGAFREDSVRSRAEPNGGGAIPLMGMGEQRVSVWVRGDKAWNMTGPAAAPAPVAVEARVHDLWTTPHGVVKAAMRSNARVRTEGGMQVVSFSDPGRYSATAWIGADGFVTRVESVMPHPVTGDTPVVTTYSGWKDWGGGVKHPARIVQLQGGTPVMDVTVTEVQTNVAFASDVPATVNAFAEKVDSQKVADGVWHLAGGSHNSVLIEFADHLMLVETPLYDERSLAVIAEAKRLVPGKPIRYVVNSHHHFDHSGGLRTAAAEGATLVVSEAARPWFERTLANPNAAKPDALRRSGQSARFIGVSGTRTFRDATRQVDIHLIEGSIHAQGFMMAWLPKERLLIEADAFTPGPPNQPAPAVPNANHVNLMSNIERLRLDVDRILPLHGRVVPIAELRTAIGR